MSDLSRDTGLLKKKKTRLIMSHKCWGFSRVAKYVEKFETTRLVALPTKQHGAIVILDG